MAMDVLKKCPNKACRQNVLPPHAVQCDKCGTPVSNRHVTVASDDKWACPPDGISKDTSFGEQESRRTTQLSETPSSRFGNTESRCDSRTESEIITPTHDIVRHKTADYPLTRTEATQSCVKQVIFLPDSEEQCEESLKQRYDAWRDDIVVATLKQNGVKVITPDTYPPQGTGTKKDMLDHMCAEADIIAIPVCQAVCGEFHMSYFPEMTIKQQDRVMFLKPPSDVGGSPVGWDFLKMYKVYDCSSEKALGKTINTIVTASHLQAKRSTYRQSLLSSSSFAGLRTSLAPSSRASSSGQRTSALSLSTERRFDNFEEEKLINEIAHRLSAIHETPQPFAETRESSQFVKQKNSTRDADTASQATGQTRLDDLTSTLRPATKADRPTFFLGPKDTTENVDNISEATGKTPQDDLDSILGPEKKVNDWLEKQSLERNAADNFSQDTALANPLPPSQIHQSQGDAVLQNSAPSIDTRKKPVVPAVKEDSEQLSPNMPEGLPPPLPTTQLSSSAYDDAGSVPLPACDFNKVPLVLRQGKVFMLRGLEVNNIPGSFSDDTNAADFIDAYYHDVLRKSTRGDTLGPVKKKYFRETDALFIIRHAIPHAAGLSCDVSRQEQWKGLVFLAAIARLAVEKQFCVFAFAMKCLCTSLVNFRTQSIDTVERTHGQLDRIIHILTIPHCLVKKHLSSTQGIVGLELYLRVHRWLCLLILAIHCSGSADIDVKNLLSKISHNCSILSNNVSGTSALVTLEKEILERYLKFSQRKYKGRLRRIESLVKQAESGSHGIERKLHTKDIILVLLCGCISGNFQSIDLRSMYNIGVKTKEIHNLLLLQILVRHLPSLEESYSRDYVAEIIERIVAGIKSETVQLKPYISLPIHRYISSLKTRHVYLNESQMRSCLEEDLAIYSCKLDAKTRHARDESRMLFSGCFGLQKETQVLIVACQLLSEKSANDQERNEVDIFKRLWRSEHQCLPVLLGYHLGVTGIQYHILNLAGPSRNLSEVLLELLKGGPEKRTLKERRRYCLQQIDALRFCHEQRILVRRLTACVFRIVKTKTGSKLKMWDFQNAQKGDGDDLSYIGSKGELLPSFWLHKKSLLFSMYDRSTDIYSCAMTVYETVSFGLYPYAELLPDKPWDARLSLIRANNMLPPRRPCIPLRLYKVIVDSTHRSLDALYNELSDDAFYDTVDRWKGGEHQLKWMQNLAENQSHVPQEGIPEILKEIDSSIALKDIKGVFPDASAQTQQRVKKRRLKRVRSGSASTELKMHDQYKEIKGRIGMVEVCIVKTRSTVEERKHLLNVCRAKTNENENVVIISELHRANSGHCKEHPMFEMYLGSESVPLLHHALDKHATHSERDRIQWYTQIAQGLSYLHKNRIVHCSLKAFYVYITGQDKSVKLGQLNRATLLCKDIHNSSEDESVVMPYEKIPADIEEWCPLETLTKGFLSTRSDVAMFGATIWELENCFNKGFDPLEYDVTPYGRTCNSVEEVILSKLSEVGLPQPEECTGWLYKLIKKMIRNDEYRRPSLSHVMTKLREKMPEVSPSSTPPMPRSSPHTPRDTPVTSYRTSRKPQDPLPTPREQSYETCMQTDICGKLSLQGAAEYTNLGAYASPVKPKSSSRKSVKSLFSGVFSRKKKRSGNKTTRIDECAYIDPDEIYDIIDNKSLNQGSSKAKAAEKPVTRVNSIKDAYLEMTRYGYRNTYVNGQGDQFSRMISNTSSDGYMAPACVDNQGHKKADHPEEMDASLLRKPSSPALGKIDENIEQPEKNLHGSFDDISFAPSKCPDDTLENGNEELQSLPSNDMLYNEDIKHMALLQSETTADEAQSTMSVKAQSLHTSGITLSAEAQSPRTSVITMSAEAQPPHTSSFTISVEAQSPHTSGITISTEAQSPDTSGIAMSAEAQSPHTSGITMETQPSTSSNNGDDCVTDSQIIQHMGARPKQPLPTVNIIENIQLLNKNYKRQTREGKDDKYVYADTADTVVSQSFRTAMQIQTKEMEPGTQSSNLYYSVSDNY